MKKRIGTKSGERERGNEIKRRIALKPVERSIKINKG